MDAVLRAAGTDRSHLVKETIYLVAYTPDRSAEVLALFANSRAGHTAAPTSTIVGVSSLFGAGYLVEIEAIAVLPDASGHPGVLHRGGGARPDLR